MGICVKWKEAVGTVDGSNALFETPTDYVTGTLGVVVNGLAITKSGLDGFSELPPNQFQMNEPPRSIGNCPDRLLVVYREL
jgi:hypothetical protein